MRAFEAELCTGCALADATKAAIRAARSWVVAGHCRTSSSSPGACTRRWGRLNGKADAGGRLLYGSVRADFCSALPAVQHLSTSNRCC